MKVQRNTKPILAALGAMLFWSFSFVWVKVAYEAYEPLTVVLLRLLISVLILLPFAFFIRRLQIPTRKDAAILLLLAFF